MPKGAWIRRGDGLEFDRAVFFTDAVFAIALTLLVVALDPPELAERLSHDPRALWSALADMTPEFISFFLAFILIGRYWMAHHVFVGQLRAMDERFIGLNLIYLAFVAFLPFPTALVGELEQNPTSVIVFAVCLAIISGLEALQLRYAYGHGLMRTQPSPARYRYLMLNSLAPVVVFVVTIPLAYVDPTLTLVSWLAIIPLSRVLDHRSPPEVRGPLLAERLEDGSDPG